MEDWLVKSEPRFRYQLLDRLRQDCNYYFGNGGKNHKNLWAGDEQMQINTMKDIWNSFPEGDKPEWITWEEILDYEERMCK